MARKPTTTTTRPKSDTAPALNIDVNPNSAKEVSPGYKTASSPGPWGFGLTLGTTPIPGSDTLIYGGPTYTPRGSFGHQTRPSAAIGISTADNLMNQFVHLTGMALGSIQSRMYRAGGYYPASFTPDYGHLRTEDIAAFKQFVIGVASNPQAAPINEALDQQAKYGDDLGINLSKKTPAIVKLSNPDDLRVTAQKVAQELYGGNLPEADLQRFVSTYQQMEASAGDQVNALGAAGNGGTVTAVPDPENVITKQIKTDHPNEYAATQFGAKMDQVIQKFAGTPPGLA